MAFVGGVVFLRSSLQPDQNPTAENSTRMVVLAGAHPAMFVAVGWSNTAAKNRDSRSLGSSYNTGIRTQANQRGFYQFIEEHGAPSGSRTGFSENDRQLGGPLLDDDTVLLYSPTRYPHYWRVESKDFYSGKGWINTIREEDLRTLPDSLRIADDNYQQDYLKEEQSSFICRIREIILPITLWKQSPHY